MKEFFDAIKSNDLDKVSRLITNANDMVSTSPSISDKRLPFEPNSKK